MLPGLVVVDHGLSRSRSQSQSESKDGEDADGRSDRRVLDVERGGNDDTSPSFFEAGHHRTSSALAERRFDLQEMYRNPRSLFAASHSHSGSHSGSLSGRSLTGLGRSTSRDVESATFGPGDEPVVQEKKRTLKKDRSKSASAAKVPGENVSKDESYVEEEVPELPSGNCAIM